MTRREFLKLIVFTIVAILATLHTEPSDEAPEEPEQTPHTIYLTGEDGYTAEVLCYCGDYHLGWTRISEYNHREVMRGAWDSSFSLPG